eukprot:549958-Pleurochrysis_carterae.AAC.1
MHVVRRHVHARSAKAHALAPRTHAFTRANDHKEDGSPWTDALLETPSCAQHLFVVALYCAGQHARALPPRARSLAVLLKQ